jgi:hypothetical protein
MVSSWSVHGWFWCFCCDVLIMIVTITMFKWWCFGDNVYLVVFHLWCFFVNVMVCFCCDGFLMMFQYWQIWHQPQRLHENTIILGSFLRKIKNCPALVLTRESVSYEEGFATYPWHYVNMMFLENFLHWCHMQHTIELWILLSNIALECRLQTVVMDAVEELVLFLNSSLNSLVITAEWGDSSSELYNHLFELQDCHLQSSKVAPRISTSCPEVPVLFIRYPAALKHFDM